MQKPKEAKIAYWTPLVQHAETKKSMKNSGLDISKRSVINNGRTVFQPFSWLKISAQALLKKRKYFVLIYQLFIGICMVASILPKQKWLKEVEDSGGVIAIQLAS